MLVNIDGCPLHVELEGPQNAPVLMLSNSLGTNLHMWDRQVEPFTQHFRLLRYDRRGHGKSGAPMGPCSMERFARDALAILDDLQVSKIHWCGLSMGAMEGMWLAAHAPGRIDKLILSNTSCYYADKDLWNDRIQAIRTSGDLASLADRFSMAWFTRDFREREPETVARMKAMLEATTVEGYVACCEAIRDMDYRDILSGISAQTLIIAGRHDQATPLQVVEFVHARIPSASLVIVDAAHISNVEQPTAYADAVLRFLRSGN